MKTALITGANRGIGLELARQLQQKDYHVIAVCRQSSDELEKLGVRVESAYDVSDAQSLNQLSDRLNGERIDLLLNNAGILRSGNLDSLDYNAIREQFEINAIAPLRVSRQLLPNLDAGAKIVIITSRMGSLQDNTSGGHYGYRMSKAAVNMVGSSLAVDLKEKGIAVALLHPGYVKTGMTNHQGLINAQESVQGLIHRIETLNLENSGGFWHTDGSELPW